MTQQQVELLEITEADILDCLALMDRANLSPKPRAVICALLSTPGFINKKEMMDHLYGDEDGPFENTICQYVCRVRAALEGSRFDVRGRYGFGYELVMYADRGEKLAA